MSEDGEQEENVEADFSNPRREEDKEEVNIQLPSIPPERP